MKSRAITNFLGWSKRFAKAIVFRDVVPCFWSKTENWGDALNPWLISRIAERPVRFDANPFCRKYLVVGSILDFADKYSTVWGTGMIAPERLPKERPCNITAVRGPLTRARLIENGISCPEIYGDPALLMPQFLKMAKFPQFKVGIIPHYTDMQHPWVLREKMDDRVRIISVYSGIEEFIREILSCEAILSSSLHGLICSDAYGIPNRRIVLNDQLVGGDFKFNDYYGAMNLTPEAPILPRFSESASDLSPAVTRFARGLDLDLLLNVCPFRKYHLQKFGV